MNFFNCTSPNQPGIVGPDNQPILDKSTLYSGCICTLDINIAPFFNKEHNSRGIGAYLNNLMLVKEGDRLDGRQSAEDAFAGIKVDDDLQ